MHMVTARGLLTVRAKIQVDDIPTAREAQLLQLRPLADELMG